MARKGKNEASKAFQKAFMQLERVATMSEVGRGIPFGLAYMVDR